MRLSYAPKLEVVIWILKYTGEVSNTVKVIFFQYTNNHFFPGNSIIWIFAEGLPLEVSMFFCAVYGIVLVHMLLHQLHKGIPLPNRLA